MKFFQFDDNFYPADVEIESAAMIHSILEDEVGRMILSCEKIQQKAIMEGVAPMGSNQVPVLGCLN